MCFPVRLFLKVTASSSLVGNVTSIHWHTGKSRTGPLALILENFWDNPAEICDSHSHLKLAYGKRTNEAKFFKCRCWFGVPLSCRHSGQNALPLTYKSTKRVSPPQLPQSFCHSHPHLSSRIPEPGVISEHYSEGSKAFPVMISRDSFISVQSLEIYTSSFGKVRYYLANPSW